MLEWYFRQPHNPFLGEIGTDIVQYDPHFEKYFVIPENQIPDMTRYLDALENGEI